MLRKVSTVLVAAGIAAVALQGCGSDSDSGGDGGSSSTVAPSPSSSGAPATTVTTTPPTTTAPPTPVGPTDPSAFPPMKGVRYIVNVACTDECPTLKDYMQVGFKESYHTKRDDLGLLRTMGANTVSVLGIGSDTKHDHSDFLDRAHELGMNVIVEFLTTTECTTDYDCSAKFEEVTTKALNAQGYKKDGAWHPAVRGLMLMFHPAGAIMNAEGTTGQADRLQITKTVLSAFDGFLLGEKAGGISNSNVSVGVAWSWKDEDSISDTKVDSLYGFKNMKAAVGDPSKVSYEIQFEELTKSYNDRWVNAVGELPSPFSDVTTRLLEPYKAADFGTQKVFFMPTTTDVSTVELNTDLPDIEQASSDYSFFLGVVVNAFQNTEGDEHSLAFFGKGATELKLEKPTPKVSWNDVLSGALEQREWTLNCLEPQDLSKTVATAWKGEVKGMGVCDSSTAEFAVAEYV